MGCSDDGIDDTLELVAPWPVPIGNEVVTLVNGYKSLCVHDLSFHSCSLSNLRSTALAIRSIVPCNFSLSFLNSSNWEFKMSIVCLKSLLSASSLSRESSTSVCRALVFFLDLHVSNPASWDYETVLYTVEAQKSWRNDTPIVKAATLNIIPSDIKLAPSSMALMCFGVYDFDGYDAHLVPKARIPTWNHLGVVWLRLYIQKSSFWDSFPLCVSIVPLG